jgi:hypothetical protein
LEPFELRFNGFPRAAQYFTVLGSDTFFVKTLGTRNHETLAQERTATVMIAASSHQLTESLAFFSETPLYFLQILHACNSIGFYF